MSPGVDDFEKGLMGPSHSRSIRVLGKGFARRNGLSCPPSGELGCSLHTYHVVYLQQPI